MLLRSATVLTLLLAAGCGLELPTANKEADEKDEKEAGEEGETAADPTAEDTNKVLASKGFAVLLGDYKLKPGEKYDCNISRFLVTVLGPNDEPVVGATMLVKRLERKDEAEDFKVGEKQKQQNKRSNVFTFLRCSGTQFEFTVAAKNYTSVTKIVDTSVEGVDVAFPINFTDAASPDKPEPDTLDDKPLPDEKPVFQRGLKHCDVRADRDFAPLREILAKHLPKEYDEIKQKFPEDKAKLVHCHGGDFPHVVLVFIVSGEKVVYDIKDASELKDYYYGKGAPLPPKPSDPAQPPPPPPLPSNPQAIEAMFKDEVLMRGSWTYQGLKLGQPFWFELGKETFRIGWKGTVKELKAADKDQVEKFRSLAQSIINVKGGEAYKADVCNQTFEKKTGIKSLLEVGPGPIGVEFAHVSGGSPQISYTFPFFDGCGALDMESYRRFANQVYETFIK